MIIHSPLRGMKISNEMEIEISIVYSLTDDLHAFFTVLQYELHQWILISITLWA